MKKVYIAGHKGLVGSAIERVFTNKGYKDIIKKTHSELDLRERDKVFEFFKKEKPEWVILSAAKVGGIYANDTYPVDFLLYNLQIQNNIIEASFENGVEKLLFLGSSCIYPKECPQPIKEEYLLSGYLESTNRAYALAKISGIELCDAYNKQYKTNYIAVMPCNLYGINDNYHKENAHVIPMLIRRFHEAKINKDKETIIWGSGTPLREFMNSDDLAEACLYLMENKDAKEIGKFINIGSGKEITIKDLANLIKKVVGFEGNIILDSSKPDGTMRKLLDVSKINNLGWHYKTELEEGLKIAYNDFLKNYKD